MCYSHAVRNNNTLNSLDSGRRTQAVRLIEEADGVPSSSPIRIPMNSRRCWSGKTLSQQMGAISTMLLTSSGRISSESTSRRRRSRVASPSSYLRLVQTPSVLTQQQNTGRGTDDTPTADSLSEIPLVQLRDVLWVPVLRFHKLCERSVDVFTGQHAVACERTEDMRCG